MFFGSKFRGPSAVFIQVADLARSLDKHCCWADYACKTAVYLDLSLHCDAEQSDEVHDEDRPENGDVEEIEECADTSDDGRFGGRIPELELWQPPDEGPELVALAGGECHPFVRLGLFCGLELGHGGVDFGRQEGQQEVKMVDCQRVGHDVPSLSLGRHKEKSSIIRKR